MPVEGTALFRAEVLRPHTRAFEITEAVAVHRERLQRWVDLFDTTEGLNQKETELLPDFITDVFQRLLGYTGPAEADEGRYTLSREKLVEVDGKFADVVLGEFGQGNERFIVAIEGKGPRDPLDRAFGGRRMSAVDQAYRYAINLPCDWILVTNLREIRLYHKGSTQRQFERFDLEDLAANDGEFKRFMFVLGAERVVGTAGRSHLHDLLKDSRKAGEKLTQEFYRAYADIRHDLLNELLNDNPETEPAAVLSAAQRLLDRTLFIAFAEDRSLLPADSLAQAYEHRDPYNPRPIWDNFRGLFKAIDEGNASLGIPRYNGGLFAEHALLDRELSVSDHACEFLKRLGDYNYGSPADLDNGDDDAALVDVEILGHIFEQSIEDLEAIQAEIEGREEVSRSSSKRKREGAFYTPAYVTRYIVTEALRPVLDEKFEALRKEHQRKAKGTTAVSVLESPYVYEVDSLNNPQREALIAFWEAWIETLKAIRVVDPGCGSGAFLIEVFDALHAEYDRAVGHLTELRPGGWAGSLFDPDRTILENNVYGVDLNEEAVEIARLSIWIKTAQRGKVLTDLDHNVQVGNSVVTDAALDPRAFDWWDAFPEVEAAGGFDVVVGNPPYVRAEAITALKPHLSSRFDAYHGDADLYVYFYELGVRLLRPGGRMSYVVTNKWLKANYAKPLRSFFVNSTWVEEVVDLGHAKEVFPDADVFPSLLRVQKPSRGQPPRQVTASTVPRDLLAVENFKAQLEQFAVRLPRTHLSEDAWLLEPPAVTAIMDRMQKVGVPLEQFVGCRPSYGIKTGYNGAFFIDTGTRDALVAEDPSCAPLIREYLRGQDIDRWEPDWGGQWAIVMKSSGDHEWPWAGRDEAEAEAIFEQEYPSLYRHFKAHEERLRARSDQGHFWWELRSCDYYNLFDEAKVVYQVIQYHPQYAFDSEGRFSNDKTYLIPSPDPFLVGVLNAPLLWWYTTRFFTHMKDEALNPAAYRMAEIPIPDLPSEGREEISSRARDLMAIVGGRRERIHDLHDWLRVEFGVDTPGRKLNNPHEIDSDTFIAEVKKRRPGGSSVTGAELRRLRDEFDRVAQPLRTGAAEALRLEIEISDLVFEAYGLTREEIDLVWKTAPPRMPIERPLASTASAAA